MVLSKTSLAEKIPLFCLSCLSGVAFDIPHQPNPRSEQHSDGCGSRSRSRSRRSRFVRLQICAKEPNFTFSHSFDCRRIPRRRALPFLVVCRRHDDNVTIVPWQSSTLRYPSICDAIQCHHHHPSEHSMRSWFRRPSPRDSHKTGDVNRSTGGSGSGSGGPGGRSSGSTTPSSSPTAASRRRARTRSFDDTRHRARTARHSHNHNHNHNHQQRLDVSSAGTLVLKMPPSRFRKKKGTAGVYALYGTDVCLLGVDITAFGWLGHLSLFVKGGAFVCECGS